MYKGYFWPFVSGRPSKKTWKGSILKQSPEIGGIFQKFPEPSIDDLSLLSPTKKGLQKLMDLCEEYAKENDILFNGNTSQFLIFKGRGNSLKDCHVNVNGTRVWNVEQATHLGHCLITITLIALLVGLMLNFGVLIYLDQTLDILIPHYSVVLLNNTVAVFMVLHCGLL